MRERDWGKGKKKFKSELISRVKGGRGWACFESSIVGEGVEDLGGSCCFR